MAKRFSNNHRFNERWYRMLDPYHKLLWEYIQGKCDISGVWEINMLDLIDDLRLPGGIDFDSFILSVNTDYDRLTGDKITSERLIRLSNNSLWITTFIKEQYESKEETVSPYNLFAKSALIKLSQHGKLGHALFKNFIPLDIPFEALRRA